MTTEAEKRVIEAAKTWVIGAHNGGWARSTLPVRCQVLMDAVDALLFESAQPLAAPPAQADVEGLEKAVKAAIDACVKAYEVWRDADGSHAKTVAHAALKEYEL